MFLVRWCCVRLPISEPQNHLSEQVHQPKEVASNHLCALLNCGLGAFSPLKTLFHFSASFCLISCLLSPLIPFCHHSFLASPSLSPLHSYMCFERCFTGHSSLLFPNCILLLFSSSRSYLVKPILFWSLSYSTTSFLFKQTPLHLFSLLPGSPPPHAVPTSCPLLCVQRWAVNTH